ncbi:MAG: bifunctional (p)ppGpp synthetase/guanosine-3',5'-bis(diphosphate) 3'-pyrophosphohydrolase [Bacteroidales bacterium]|nr:bifunctional (p)ppGpp synthetase/guanosine-3',5'-bis(diphosphate) 3'-pyrophosphohydrolase [Bacteroidales bacterium]
MPNGPINTELLDRAILFAVKAHTGTERRGKGIPYIVHPMEAMEIVSTLTKDQELMAAAALHDTVEDTSVTVEDIRREFGDRVADLVYGESDVFIEGETKEESWRRRKLAAIERLAASSLDVKMVALGDKLSNMRAIARDFAVVGDELWNIFHTKNRFDHEWHYRGLAKSLGELSGTAAYEEFTDLIDKVFGNGTDKNLD